MEDVLQQVPLFSGLKGKQLKRIAEAMTERAFSAGEEITKEGEVSVGFYVIEEGRASVTMNDQLVGELGPGDHFGEISLIAETPRAATVMAETDMRCQGMTSWDFASSSRATARSRGRSSPRLPAWSMRTRSESALARPRTRLSWR